MRGRVREAFDRGPTLPDTLVSCSVISMSYSPTPQPQDRNLELSIPESLPSSAYCSSPPHITLRARPTIETSRSQLVATSM
jgi:hypothetical protein